MVDRRLGRGLDFFLSRESAEAELEDTANTEGRILDLPLDSLDPNPFQPRKTFPEAELAELAASIRQSGILQPIVVRQVGERYQIIAGERRLRASRLAGLERIPSIVRAIEDEAAAVLGLVENVQRADLNALEKARAFQQLQELTGVDQEEVARRVGLERSTVANFVRLLRLPEEVQGFVAQGTLSMGQARALLGLEDHERIQAGAERCIRHRLSVRQTEDLVRELRAKDPTDPDLGKDGKPRARKPKKDAWLREIEENLRSALGAQVDVRYGRRKSKIVIETDGRDEFERVYDSLRQLGD